MYEIKKMLFYRKGLIVICVLLAVQCVSFAIADKQRNNREEYRSEKYLYYLDQVKGKYTEEKALFLEKEAVRISEAKAARKILLENYYDGKIKEESFNEKLNEIDRVLKNNRGFDEIFSQYLYICQNTNNRYFIEKTGWELMFTQGSIPICIIIVILLLVIPIFCSEYEIQMDILISSSRSGRKSTMQKIGIAILVSLFICLTISIIQFCYVKWNYGLPQGYAPIQSLEMYGESTKSITLWEGVVWLLLSRCIGGIFLALEILILSVLTKKYSLTVFLSTASIVIPYLGLGDNQMYRFPLPLCFLLGSGYLQGNNQRVDELTGESITIFKEISTGYIGFLVSISALLCILFLYIIFKKTENKWCRHKKQMRYIGMTTIISMSLFLAGCNRKDEEASVVTYNSLTAYEFENEEYKVYSYDKDSFPVYENKRTGEVKDLIRDPMILLTEKDKSVDIMEEIFAADSKIYYARLDSKDYRRRVGDSQSRVVKLSIIEMNLKNLEEKKIFEKIISTGRDFLGISYNTSDKWGFMELQTGFFLNNSSIFIVCNDGIYQIERDNEKLTFLDIPTNYNIAFDGKDIYFIDNDLILSRYDTNTQQTYKVIETAVYQFYLTNDTIVFINREDAYKVYDYNLKTKEVVKLLDKQALSFEIEENHIYITDKNDGKKYEVYKKN